MGGCKKGQLFHNGRNGRDKGHYRTENCTKQEAPPGVLSSLRRTLTVSMKILNSDSEFRPTIRYRTFKITPKFKIMASAPPGWVRGPKGFL